MADKTPGQVAYERALARLREAYGTGWADLNKDQQATWEQHAAKEAKDGLRNP